MNKPIFEYESPEIRGYELLHSDTIKCANCKKPLIDIIKVKDNVHVIKEIQCSCPFCDDGSFKYKIVGETYMQASKGVILTDIDTGYIDNIIILNIKVMKDE